jgi:lipid-binding SYLF domain-containing protein
MNLHQSLHRSILAAVAVGVTSLATTAMAKDPAAARAERRKMCDEALAAAYKGKPELKAHIAKSAGYACFSSFGISFFIGGAGGAGLVYDNATKRTTYMKMGQATGGIDFGIKDYREVLVFKDAKTLREFMDKGWEFGGSGQAAAAVEGKGAQATDTQVSSSPITACAGEIAISMPVPCTRSA